MRIKLAEGLVSVNTPGATIPSAAPVGGVGGVTGKKPNQQQTTQPFKLDFSSDQSPRLNLTPNISTAGTQPGQAVSVPTLPGGVQSSQPKPAEQAPVGGIGLTRALPSNMVGTQSPNYNTIPLVGGSQQQQPDSFAMGSITSPVTAGGVIGPGNQAPLMTNTGEVNPQALSTSSSAGAVAPPTTSTYRPATPTGFMPSGTAKPNTGASLTQVAAGTATPTQLAMMGVGEEKPKPEQTPKEQPMDAAVDEFRNKQGQKQNDQQAREERRKKVKELRRARETESEAEEELKHARFLRKQARSAERFQALSARNRASREHTRSSSSSAAPLPESYKFKRGDLKIMLSEDMWDTMKKYATNAGSALAVPPQLAAAYGMGLVGHMGASRAASDIWKKHYADMFRGGVKDITGLVGLGTSKLAPQLQKIPGISKGLEKLSKIASAVPYLGTLGKRALNYGQAASDGAAEAFGVLAKRALFNPTTTDEYQIGDNYRSAVNRSFRNY